MTPAASRRAWARHSSSASRRSPAHRCRVSFPERHGAAQAAPAGGGGRRIDGQGGRRRGLSGAARDRARLLTPHDRRLPPRPDDPGRPAQAGRRARSRTGAPSPTRHMRRWVAQLSRQGLGAKSLARMLSAWRGFFDALAEAGKVTSTRCGRCARRSCRGDCRRRCRWTRRCSWSPEPEDAAQATPASSGCATRRSSSCSTRAGCGCRS